MTTKRSVEEIAKEVFKSCILTNFCSCDCHKSIKIPGSVVDAVAKALSTERSRAEKAGRELASHKIACESFNHVEIIQLKEDLAYAEAKAEKYRVALECVDLVWKRLNLYPEVNALGDDVHEAWSKVKQALKETE